MFPVPGRRNRALALQVGFIVTKVKSKSQHAMSQADLNPNAIQAGQIPANGTCACGCEAEPVQGKGAPAAGSPSSAESYLDQVQALVEGWSGRPSWDEYFMATALLIASRSSCDRLHVGCVLVSGGHNPNRIIAAGYNGFLSGHPHLSRVRDNHEQGTVHAEQNALADAARRGISVQGATAYVTHFPCIICTRLLLASGIASVKYRFDYKNDPMALELWAEAGIGVTQLK